MMGLSNWLHWTAWFIKYTLLLFITVLILTILLVIKTDKGAVIAKSNPIIIFIFLMLYAISIISFSCLVSVFFSKGNYFKLYYFKLMQLYIVPSVIVLTTSVVYFVMVIVLASSVVDSGFEPRSSQTIDYEIGICCFSAEHTALRRRSKDWLARLGIRVMCQSGVTCLSADCCFNELVLSKSNLPCWSSTKQTSSSSH